MNKEEIFSAWAPETSCWSPWVKPVLFACMDALTTEPSAPEPPGVPASLPADLEGSEDAGKDAGAPGKELATPAETGVKAAPEPAWDTSWVPPVEARAALVLDLPCAEGVLLGLELAIRGYRPVPLYNAVPLPSGEPQFDSLTGKPVAAVQVLPILVALRGGAAILAQIPLPPEAPPIFLLDALRRGGGRTMLPDEFDNRSVCFTTDFPSANFLTAHQIRSVVLVQRSGDQPQLDLAHVLRRWQQAGLAMKLKRLDTLGPPLSCEIARPSWFGTMFQRALASLGLRRGEAGGFGAWITDTSAGG